jgi:Family of unknown function (DUF5719)
MDPVSDDQQPATPRTAAARTTAARAAAGRVASARGALGKAAPQAAARSGRRTTAALAVLVAVAIGLGYGYMTHNSQATAATAATHPTAVHSTTVVCPTILGSNDATLSAYTPSGQSAGGSDAATVQQIGAKAPAITLKQTGSLVVASGLSGTPAVIPQDSQAAVGQAGGGYAPGFTLTDTLASGTVGSGHGLASTACQSPDTGFWFIGAGTDTDPLANLEMTDSDSIPAQVNLDMFTPNGEVTGQNQQDNQGLLVPAGGQANPIDLDYYAGGANPVAVHVTATDGRVAAALLDADSKGGGRDFITPQTASSSQLIPGIPQPPTKGTMRLSLSLLAPTQDTTVTLHWIGQGIITPTVPVAPLTAGKVAVVDLSSVPVSGEPAALEVDSSGNVPIVAGIKVTMTGTDGSDTAYLSPTAPLSGPAIVADNRAGSLLELTNTGKQDEQVQVIEQGPTGAAVQSTATAKAGATTAVPLTAPKGASSFAVEIVPPSGGGPLYAARIMVGTGPLITIQPMTTALITVEVPAVRNDLSGAVPQ